MSRAQIRATQPRISIVGAGIAGLSLAVRLSRIGVPFTIYEARKEQSIGHNYAITLTKGWRKHAGEMFHKNNHESRASAFRKSTACDRLIGGVGQVHNDSKADSRVFQAVDKDVRKFLIDELAWKKIEVKWEHKLVEVREAEGREEGQKGKGVILRFENNYETVADIIVDSGGLGSSSFYQNIAQPAPPKLLPYATYYGTRRISFKDFEERFADYFGNGNVIKFVPSEGQGEQTPLLSVQKIHVQKESDKSEEHTVELRWVFSRPSLGDSDPLYRPNRAKEEAKIIPSELFEAILDLVKNNDYSKKMKKFVAELFRLSDIENDRVLNWHLRLQLQSYADFCNHSNRGSHVVCAIGDAAHGLPIFESRGAMVAMDDARALSTVLEDLWKGVTIHGFEFNPYTPSYDRWVYEAREAVQRLRLVHGQESLTEDELDSLVGKYTESRPENTEDSEEESPSTSEDNTIVKESSKI